MESLNRIIKGLEICNSGGGCGGCPYTHVPEHAGPEYECNVQLLTDATEALKEYRNEQNCQ